MKTGLKTVFLLALAGTLAGTITGSLSGCGQKGPLYHEVPAEASAEQAVRQEQDDER